MAGDIPFLLKSVSYKWRDKIMSKRKSQPLFETQYLKSLGIHSSDGDKLHAAYDFANECRKFEIENFWKRGTYYWAYITGSCAAYGMLLLHFFDSDKKVFSLLALANLPFLSRLALFVLSFLIFFFCLSWTFINKGSKFWQKSWEAHLISLEDSISGKIYRTFLDTDKNRFSGSIFNTKAYNYSVSKITTLCSIFMTIVTTMLSVFHFCLLFITDDVCEFLKKTTIKVIIGLVLILAIIVLLYKVFVKCKGNSDSDSKNISTETYIWKQVKKV